MSVSFKMHFFNIICNSGTRLAQRVLVFFAHLARPLFNLAHVCLSFRMHFLISFAIQGPPPRCACFRMLRSRHSSFSLVAVFLCSNAFFDAPLIATTIAWFQHLSFFFAPFPWSSQPSVVSLHFLFFFRRPWSPQPLRRLVTFIFSPPPPPLVA